VSIAVRSRRVALALALCVIALPAEALAQSAVPSSGPPVTPQPLPAESAPVAPGRYRSGVGTGTNVTFDVADRGWVGQGGAMVVMDRAAGDDAGELMVTTFDAAAVDPCLREGPDTNGSQDVAQDAQAFTQWLLAQPWAVSTSSPTTLGGEPATQVDISALKPPCPDQSMFVWYYLDGGPYRLFPTEGVRVIAQDRRRGAGPGDCRDSERREPAGVPRGRDPGHRVHDLR
jgi:hypothetical protein